MPVVLTTVFLISLSLLAVIHYLALQFFLYWNYSWFDIPMHIFGGAIVALGILMLLTYSGERGEVYISALNVVIGVFVIALFWEAFQVSLGLNAEENYVFDTTIDLIAGMVGGSIGYIVGTRLISLEE